MLTNNEAKQIVDTIVACGIGQIEDVALTVRRAQLGTIVKAALDNPDDSYTLPERFVPHEGGRLFLTGSKRQAIEKVIHLIDDTVNELATRRGHLTVPNQLLGQLTNYRIGLQGVLDLEPSD